MPQISPMSWILILFIMLLSFSNVKANLPQIFESQSKPIKSKKTKIFYKW